MEMIEKMKALFGILGLLVLVTGPGASHAAGPMTSSVNKDGNPLLQKVATRCTRLIRRGSSETLVNTCNTCRIVSVTRKRTGISTPVRREFNLAARSRFPVPFRGPGNTRITSDILCKGSPSKSAHPINSVQTKKCVALEQRQNGKVVLVNSCGTCRGVAVHRVNKAGRSLGLQAYKLFPQAVAQVAPKGATSVTISGEVACPS